MPQYQPKRYEQILQQILARIVTRTDLSDVTDASAVKHIAAATARAIDELYYQASLLLQLFSIDKAEKGDLDARAKDIQPGTLTRIPAVKAVGVVTFSRLVAVGSVSVPVGTSVTTASGTVFTTTAVGTLANGIGSVAVPVAAQLPGSAGNVVAGTIVKFQAKPTGVDTCTNANGCTQGQDQESDDQFRARIKQYVAGLARSTVGALESCVLGAQDPATGATILFSKAIEDTTRVGYVTLYIDDGTGSATAIVTTTSENMCAGLSGPPPNSAVGGEQRLYLNVAPVKMDSAITLTSSTRGALTGSQYTVDGVSGLIVFSPALATGEQIFATYTSYTGLIALGQRIVDGVPSNRAQYPGYRAAGVRVVVAAPQVNLITVNATLTVAEGYNSSTIQASVVAAIKQYINSLEISGDVIKASLYAAIMAVPGVANVLLTMPAGDITILDNQLARTQTANITVY